MTKYRLRRPNSVLLYEETASITQAMAMATSRLECVECGVELKAERSIFVSTSVNPDERYYPNIIKYVTVSCIACAQTIADRILDHLEA